jgi:hypothetical protein
MATVEVLAMRPVALGRILSAMPESVGSGHEEMRRGAQTIRHVRLPDATPFHGSHRQMDGEDRLKISSG